MSPDLLTDDPTPPDTPRVTGEHPVIRLGMSAGAKALGAVVAAAVVGASVAVYAKWGAVDDLRRSNDTQHRTINSRLLQNEDRTEDIYRVVVEKADPLTVMRDRARITQERLRSPQP